MAYADTAEAIGEVSELIRARLQAESTVPTYVGRPEPPTDGVARLNLFLYETVLDPTLKNFSPDEDNAPPLWLVLKYLITSFDEQGKSDTVKAHRALSKGIQALQGLNFLSGSTQLALQPNPEKLKITFDAISSDLIAKIMQGPDEKYRFSMGFQVRPVMIAAREEPSYALLVGVDYTTAPPAVVGEELIHIPVLPAMGALISRLEPAKFEARETVTIFGEALNIGELFVRVGSVDIGTSMQKSTSLKFKLASSGISGQKISAGSHAVTVVQKLPGGRYRSSNMLVGALLPQVDTVTTQGALSTQNGYITGVLKVSGQHLGRVGDDIVLALFQSGKVIKVLEGKVAQAAAADVMFVVSADQSELTVTIRKADRLAPGVYRSIMRINGQQARLSPEVNLTQ
jgi:hypothetical protein